MWINLLNLQRVVEDQRGIQKKEAEDFMQSLALHLFKNISNKVVLSL